MITISKVLVDPLYSKIISTADGSNVNYGVGGFYFIYSIVGVSIILFWNLLYDKKV